MNFTKIESVECSCCNNISEHISDENEFFCNSCMEEISHDIANDECEPITFESNKSLKCTCGSDADFFEHDTNVILCADCSFVIDHEAKHDYMPDDFYLESRL